MENKLHAEMHRDKLQSPVIPQVYNTTTKTFTVLSNGDVSNIDFNDYEMIRDFRGSPIPNQYFDVGTMKFVVGTLATGGGEGGTAIPGPQGPPGKDAYLIAVDGGFAGTTEEWLASLKGEPGEDGKSLTFDDLTDEQKEALRGEPGKDAEIPLPLSATEIAQTSELQLISSTLKALIQTNKTDIESIIQRFAQIEQELQNAASTDELVAGDAEDEAGYLSEKIDGVTIKYVNKKLVAAKLIDLIAEVAELNSLIGIRGNVQAQLDAMLKVVNPQEIFATKADLPALPNETYTQSITVLVQADEEHEGATTFYMSTGTEWQYVNKINSDVLRDFLTDPLNIVTETYGVLPKDRYEKQNATETPFTDPTGTLQSTNTNDAIVELLRLADSAKQLIVSTIGYPLLRTDTWEQIAVKILNMKRTLVDLLNAKSVAATENNTLLELINKVAAIPNVEITAGIQRIERMTVTAPYTHQIVLNEALQTKDVAVSLIEYLTGNTNQLHYNMNFDKADADRLVMTNETVVDGSLHLKNKYEINLTPDPTYTGEGKLYTATVNKSDFVSIASVTAKVRE